MTSRGVVASDALCALWVNVATGAGSSSSVSLSVAELIVTPESCPDTVIVSGGW